MEDFYSVRIGMDWSDGKHDLSVLCEADEEPRYVVLSSAPEALEEWLLELRAQHREGRFAVCIEQSRGAAVYLLLRFDFVDVYPLNPMAFDQYRKSFHPSGCKNDGGDAGLLLDYLLKHPERLRKLEPDPEPVRKLRFLCEERRKEVDERTRLGNRLVSILKECFPQALELTGEDIYADLALAFLEKWPVFQSFAQAAPKTITHFYGKRRTTPKTLERALEVRRQGRPLTDDPAILDVSILKIRSLTARLKDLNASIAIYNREIAATEGLVDETRLFASFPAAGAALRPRLAVAFGTDRSRLASAQEAQCYLGVAPVTVASGKQRWVHWRWNSSKFLRQTMVEYAWVSTRKSDWAAKFYRMQKARGHSHQAALRSLAYKWVRIMYRCWQNGEPYDEARYVKTLKEKTAWYQNAA